MPAIDVDTRWRLLDFLHRCGMPEQLCRAVDAAAAQSVLHSGDPWAYAAFAHECHEYWLKNKALPARAVMRGAVQPLPTDVHSFDARASHGKHSAAQAAVLEQPASAESVEERARAQQRDEKRKRERSHLSICIKCKCCSN